MPTNLYTIVKKLERRTRDDPDDFHKWELTELALDLISCHPDRDELVAITQRMFAIERLLPYYMTTFAGQMRQAIEADDFIIKLPYANPRSADTSTKAEGFLYVAFAWSRPGLVKLGATHRPLQQRIDAYAERYGYPVSAFWSAKVRRPFCLEAKIMQTLTDFLAPAGAYGDAVGWYRMTPEELEAIVKKALEVR